jgi:4-oxalocrotonate tautomerase
LHHLIRFIKRTERRTPMPMIIIRYVTPETREDLRPNIAALASRLAQEQLGKDPAVTTVLVEPADPQSWFIAGQQPTKAGLAAFWLDIKITAGTNTKAETAGFVKTTFEGMRALLGPLHEESYALVHGADGDAYGYGGRTQNARWAVAHPG